MLFFKGHIRLCLLICCWDFLRHCSVFSLLPAPFRDDMLYLRAYLLIWFLQHAYCILSLLFLSHKGDCFTTIRQLTRTYLPAKGGARMWKSTFKSLNHVAIPITPNLTEINCIWPKRRASALCSPAPFPCYPSHKNILNVKSVYFQIFVSKYKLSCDLCSYINICRLKEWNVFYFPLHGKRK